jgi:hypothetical protein
LGEHHPALSPADVENAVDRCIAEPAVALAGPIGARRIAALRRKAAQLHNGVEPIPASDTRSAMADSFHTGGQRVCLRPQQLQSEHGRVRLRHRFIAPAREGDVLTAVAHERSVSGRTGVYDIEVANQRGEKIALFRGKSYRIKGHVIDGEPAT